MERAVEGRSVHHRRRLVLGFAVLAAVSVPLAAFGAANDWWFLNNRGAPAPTTAPQVVKEGEWDGQPWQLIAYPSASHGLCFSITPEDSGATGEGGAMSCGPFVGLESRASPEITIAALVGGGSAKLPAYIAGPVIDEASVSKAASLPETSSACLPSPDRSRFSTCGSTRRSFPRTSRLVTPPASSPLGSPAWTPAGPWSRA